MEVEVSEWLRRCRDAQVRGERVPHQLFRRLIRHDGWICSPDTWKAASHGDVYLAGASGVPNLLMGPMTGLELAHALPMGMVGLDFHFGDALPLALDSEAVAEVRTFLQVVVVEELLARLYAGVELEVSEPFARLRGFEHYYILCGGAQGAVDSEELRPSSLRIAFAPDPEGGRSLAAIFTAQDALQLFVVATPARGTDGLVSVRLSGKELFAMVQQQEGLDGLVFNPAGPGQAIALSCAIAADVLDSDG